jgi:hypothetical protein
MTGTPWTYTTRHECAGGGGYEGGGKLITTMNSNIGGRGGTSYGATGLDGYVASSYTASFTSSDANGYATSHNPPQTSDADYIANQYCLITRALVGQGAKATPLGDTYESAGNGLIVIDITT